ncbi:ribosomal protein S18-alanine N-acetyltransferase [Aquipuribacter sp. SD81]|uniref:ribosomal protein S18-alanine N-acetyltransferase n=1 Tax=Aquipuribacter sp. SD81 TaxID=3127703 RepID=UPI003017EDBF
MSVPAAPPAPEGLVATGVRVRRLRWWDVDEVAAAEPEAFGPDAWSREALLSELAADGRVYERAEDADGRLLGYAGTAAHGPDAELQTVAVLPAARGRGLGATLLQRACARARADGARRLHLEVREDNDAALALYARAGFGRVGRRPGYYAAAAPDAARVAAVLMTLDLVTAERG